MPSLNFSCTSHNCRVWPGLRAAPRLASTARSLRTTASRSPGAGPSCPSPLTASGRCRRCLLWAVRCLMPDGTTHVAGLRLPCALARCSRRLRWRWRTLRRHWALGGNALWHLQLLRFERRRSRDLRRRGASCVRQCWQPEGCSVNCVGSPQDRLLDGMYLI